jgi:hypothetical protein
MEADQVPEYAAWVTYQDELDSSTDERLDWSEAVEELERRHSAWLRAAIIKNRCLLCGFEQPHTWAYCQERRGMINRLMPPR